MLMDKLRDGAQAVSRKLFFVNYSVIRIGRCW